MIFTLRFTNVQNKVLFSLTNSFSVILRYEKLLNEWRRVPPTYKNRINSIKYKITRRSNWTEIKKQDSKGGGINQDLRGRYGS